MFAYLCVVLNQKLIKCHCPVVKSQGGRLKHTSSQSSNTKFTIIHGSCGMHSSLLLCPSEILCGCVLAAEVLSEN